MVRVGDKVRIKKNYYNGGCIGVIQHVDVFGGWIRVKFKDGSGGWYLLDEVEPIKPKSLLKSRIGED